MHFEDLFQLFRPFMDELMERRSAAKERADAFWAKSPKR